MPDQEIEVLDFGSRVGVKGLHRSPGASGLFEAGIELAKPNALERLPPEVEPETDPGGSGRLEEKTKIPAGCDIEKTTCRRNPLEIPSWQNASREHDVVPRAPAKLLEGFDFLGRVAVQPKLGPLVDETCEQEEIGNREHWKRELHVARHARTGKRVGDPPRCGLEGLPIIGIEGSADFGTQPAELFLKPV
jgi:hypothetical protein